MVAWWDSRPAEGMSQDEKMLLFFSLFLFSLFYHTPAHLFSHSGFLSPPLASSPAPAAPPIFSLLCSVSPLLFYLLPVNRGVVQDLVITPGSVWLLADCCRGTVLAWCWGTHRLLGLLAEALYCVCLNVLIVTLYSTHLLYCTSLRGTFTHPSSLCPLFLRLRGSDGKVEGGPEAREQDCHCADDWQESCSTQT